MNSRFFSLVSIETSRVWPTLRITRFPGNITSSSLGFLWRQCCNEYIWPEISCVMHPDVNMTTVRDWTVPGQRVREAPQINQLKTNRTLTGEDTDQPGPSRTAHPTTPHCGGHDKSSWPPDVRSMEAPTRYQQDPDPRSVSVDLMLTWWIWLWGGAFMDLTCSSVPQMLYIILLLLLL